MLDTLEDSNNYGYSFGTSPPNRPFVAEGSDLFRAVMEDFKQDTTSNNRLANAVVDSVLAKSNDNSNDSQTNGKGSTTGGKYMCKRCLSDRTLCRCYKGHEKGAIHRVQWVDQIYDKPLAIEQCISDISLDSLDQRCSPENMTLDSVKPILKHKANCIIIISE